MYAGQPGQGRFVVSQKHTETHGVEAEEGRVHRVFELDGDFVDVALNVAAAPHHANHVLLSAAGGDQLHHDRGSYVNKTSVQKGQTPGANIASWNDECHGGGVAGLLHK